MHASLDYNYACVALHKSSTSTSCISIILCVAFFLHLSSESKWNSGFANNNLTDVELFPELI